MVTEENVERMKETLKESGSKLVESFSTLLGKEMEVSDVSVREARLEDVVGLVDKPDSRYSCIQVEITGESEIKKTTMGHFLALVDESSSKKMIETVGGNQQEIGKNFDFFREIGNITSGAFMSPVSEFFGFEFKESLPDFCFDMLRSGMDSVVCSVAAETEKTLIFSLDLEADGILMKFIVIFYPHVYDLLELKGE